MTHRGSKKRVHLGKFAWRMIGNLGKNSKIEEGTSVSEKKNKTQEHKSNSEGFCSRRLSQLKTDKLLQKMKG